MSVVIMFCLQNDNVDEMDQLCDGLNSLSPEKCGSNFPVNMPYLGRKQADATGIGPVLVQLRQVMACWQGLQVYFSDLSYKLVSWARKWLGTPLMMS